MGASAAQKKRIEFVPWVAQDGQIQHFAPDYLADHEEAEFVGSWVLVRASASWSSKIARAYPAHRVELVHGG